MTTTPTPDLAADPAIVDALILAEANYRLTYEKETGNFFWLRPKCVKFKPGHPAGGKNKNGYIFIRIHGKAYLAHRLAWLMTYGCFPPAGNEIDHMNGVRSDNRISNLRSVSAKHNSQNQRRPSRNNRSGFLGISQKPGGRYQADINIDGKKLYLGRYSSAQEASEAYIKAKRKLHPGAML